MPMIPCPDCRARVSDSAATCPDCGAALKVRVVILTDGIQVSLLAKDRVQVYLDDESAGWLADNSRLVFHVRPGSHTLKAKRQNEAWCKASVSFTAQGGDAVEFTISKAWHAGLVFRKPSAGRS